MLFPDNEYDKMLLPGDLQFDGKEILPGKSIDSLSQAV